MIHARRALAAAAAASALACAVGVAVAQAVAPPAGTPDLASMTVQSSDLAPGAELGTDAYARPHGKFTAEYDRNYSLAQAAAGGPPFILSTSLMFAPKASVAGAYLTEARALFASKLGRRLFASVLVAARRQAVACLGPRRALHEDHEHRRRARARSPSVSR